jgi:PAS domain S-box-containing protein
MPHDRRHEILVSIVQPTDLADTDGGAKRWGRRAMAEASGAARGASPVKPRLRVHRITIALVLIGALGVGASAIAVGRTVSSDERQILVGRSAEATTVVAALVSTVQSSLTAVSAAVAQAGASRAFNAVAGSPVGKSFSGMALLQESGAAATVVARQGSLLGLAGAAGVPGSIGAALNSGGPGLHLIAFFGSGPGRRLGVALGAPLAPAGTALYAELPLPEGMVTPSSDPTFADLDYAIYLGREDGAHVVFASTGALPLTGLRAVVDSVPGSTLSPTPQVGSAPGSASGAPGDLILVLTPRGSLVGGFEAALPWGLATVGLIVVLLFGAVTESALRRRDAANAIAATLKERNEDLDRAVASEGAALAALRESEHNYRVLFEDNPEPMWVYDATTLRFLAVNDSAVSHYGYLRDEFLAKTIQDIRPPEDRDLPNPVAADGGGSRHQSGPWRTLRSDGSVILVEITSHPITFGDTPARSVIARDVTDQERLRRQTEQSQRLESLGQLAGGVAHDFNNMLSVILACTGFAQERVAAEAARDGRWAQAAEDLAQVQVAGESAARLTRQLLAFAKRDVVAARVLDLNTVVADVERLLRRTLGEHVELTTVLGADLWAVEIDPGRIEQILVNLAVNARDAMASGGRLVIDTENVTVDEEYAATHAGMECGRYVRLRVGDTGVGMPPDVLARAFEPFFTTKPHGEGTGLGLATIYGIVGQAGGHTWIYSEHGVGTTVTVLLPAVSVEVTVETAPAVRGRTGHGETVLVVEDEPAIRELARRILERNNYEVLIATSPADAIASAEDPSVLIDLVITDVVMPQMLGREVAERITGVRPHLPVLYMSGYAPPILASKGALDPGMFLVEKPFSESSLLTKVREVLDTSATTVYGRAEPGR